MHFDRDRYSVPASFPNRPVSVRIMALREFRQRRRGLGERIPNGTDKPPAPEGRHAALAARSYHRGTAVLEPDGQPLLRDLDRLQVATLTKGGKAITIRTPVAGQVGSVFRAAGVALPPNVQDTAAAWSGGRQSPELWC